MEEIWKEIHGYGGRYFISNHGRLKSIGGRKYPNGYISLGSIDFIGYRITTLRRDNKKKDIRIHVLVANAFIPNPQNKPNVNHIDGDKGNNNACNLEWVTQKENIHHAIRIGLMNNKGSNHGMSKLNESQVREIRKIRKEQNLSHQKIADMFKINRRQCGDILNGVNWGWLI